MRFNAVSRYTQRPGFFCLYSAPQGAHSFSRILASDVSHSTTDPTPRMLRGPFSHASNETPASRADIFAPGAYGRSCISL
jgi:hypothetical protein